MGSRLKLPKVLVLDYRTWICGGGLKILDEVSEDVPVGTGVGDVALLNDEGKMCCLGQFSCQAGVKKDSLLGRTMPASSMLPPVECLTTKNGSNSNLSYDAAKINDTTETTILEKVVKLRTLFGKHGRVIKLKNFPSGLLTKLANNELK